MQKHQRLAEVSVNGITLFYVSEEKQFSPLTISQPPQEPPHLSSSFQTGQVVSKIFVLAAASTIHVLVDDAHFSVADSEMCRFVFHIFLGNAQPAHIIIT